MWYIQYTVLIDSAPTLVSVSFGYLCGDHHQLWGECHTQDCVVCPWERKDHLKLLFHREPCNLSSPPLGRKPCTLQNVMNLEAGTAVHSRFNIIVGFSVDFQCLYVFVVRQRRDHSLLVMTSFHIHNKSSVSAEIHFQKYAKLNLVSAIAYLTSILYTAEEYCTDLRTSWIKQAMQKKRANNLSFTISRAWAQGCAAWLADVWILRMRWSSWSPFLECAANQDFKGHQCILLFHCLPSFPPFLSEGSFLSSTLRTMMVLWFLMWTSPPSASSILRNTFSGIDRRFNFSFPFLRPPLYYDPGTDLKSQRRRGQRMLEPVSWKEWAWRVEKRVSFLDWWLRRCRCPYLFIRLIFYAN